jgi:hypothetical protein
MTRDAKRELLVGLDLGTVTDHSALVIVECTHVDQQLLCAVRHLHRFPLSVSFAAIAANVRAVIQKAELESVPVLLDITAVGPEVVPFFRTAVQPAWVVPVLLTADGMAVKDDSNTWRVPKRDLITTMQLLLQEQRFQIASALPESALLVQELKEFRLRVPVNTTNPDVLDWRDRPHDDLVLATALACWWANGTLMLLVAGSRWSVVRVGTIGIVCLVVSFFRRLEVIGDCSTPVLRRPRPRPSP